MFVIKEKSIRDAKGDPPEHFDGYFNCQNAGLTSLEGAPRTVSGAFECKANSITSLEGVPSSIGGPLGFYNNKLTSLHNIHKLIKHIGGKADFEKNPITSCVLGLLLIDGLKIVCLDNVRLDIIMNTHLAGDRDIFACQEELIEAGLDEYAQL